MPQKRWRDFLSDLYTESGTDVAGGEKFRIANTTEG